MTPGARLRVWSSWTWTRTDRNQKKRKATDNASSRWLRGHSLARHIWQKKFALDDCQRTMYAFSPVQCDPPRGCYVELTRLPLHGIQCAPRGNHHLRRYQSRLVFDIACQTLGVWTPYAVEKQLMGDAFVPGERTRWWEKLCYGRLDLPRALERRDPVSKMWLDRLADETSEATRVLSMPLWALSTIGHVTVDAVVSWRGAVSAMGLPIPEFPTRSKQGGKLYVNQLFEPMGSGDTTWAGLNIALFCLRLAQARGDLASYVLTYEAIASDRWRRCMMCAGPAADQCWRDLAMFYGEWFSTLRLRVSTEVELLEVQEDLQVHGLSTQLTAISRVEDPRYEFVDRLMVGRCPPPTVEESIFIAARYTV